MNNRRFWISTLLAWLVFLGIDFLFHGSIFQTLWQEELQAIKATQELFILIPFGYASFLLLVILIGYCFINIYPSKPEIKQVTGFALVFSLLYSLSNFLGLFSYVNIPLQHLLQYNLVYYIEILAVVFIFYYSSYAENIRGITWISILSFLGLVAFGIIIQNLN